MTATTIDTARITPAALKSADAALYLGLASKTLANYRLAGIGHRYVRTSGSSRSGVLYRVTDLDAWLEENLVVG